MHSTPGRAIERVRWTFEGRVFDEASWQLHVGDAPVEIENKPLLILVELLGKAGEVVTRQELLEQVWPGLSVVEGSLTTAISKLRKALDDPDGAIVATVPRFGYRLAVPVTREVVTAQAPDLALEAGQPVPGRPQWRLDELLRQGPDRETWAAVQDKTGERRVFKLTADAMALRTLKREVAVARVLRGALGERPDFVPILEWNFEAPPFFTESGWAGPSLPDWAEARGGLASLPMAQRIAFLAAVCETVAAAHGVGTIHRDIKPSNILVRTQEAGEAQPCIIDFGSADLIDPAVARRFEVTWTGAIDEPQGAQGTSQLWLAPEVARGGPATTASDVYALGVLIYQVVVGDLMRPLAPGWEADIADPLLRADVAEAAAGEPERRIAGAGALAERLRKLDERRAAAAREAQEAAQAAAMAERLKRVQARRPWLVTAMAALVLGVTASTVLYARAARDRDEADRQRRIAEQVADFLGTDLLGQTSPFAGDAADETLIDATRRAVPLIDLRFTGEPQVAAELYQKIAAALDQRSDFDGSREAYAKAVAYWTEAGGADSAPARIARARQGIMEARSQQQGGLEAAERILAELDDSLARVPPGDEETVRIEVLRGTIAFAGGDMDKAEAAHVKALAAAANVPTLEPTFELGMRNRLILIRMRKGNAEEADEGYRQLAREWAEIEGPDGPNALIALSIRAQALNMLDKPDEALTEANRLIPLMRQSALGPDHLYTLLLESARVGFLAGAERYEDVSRVGPPAYARIARVMGAQSATAVDLLKTLALSQCRSGNVAAGRRDADRARADAAQLGDPGIRGGALYAAADCAILARDYGDAERLLNSIDRAAMAAATGEPDWGGMVDLGLARIASARGDLAGAARHLKAAEPAFKGANDYYESRLWRELSQSEG